MNIYDNKIMNSHISNLKEVGRLFCMDCKEKKAGIAICDCPLSAQFCPYIKSINFAIEFLERIKEEE